MRVAGAHAPGSASGLPSRPSRGRARQSLTAQPTETRSPVNRAPWPTMFGILTMKSELPQRLRRSRKWSPMNRMPSTPASNSLLNSPGLARPTRSGRMARTASWPGRHSPTGNALTIPSQSSGSQIPRLTEVMRPRRRGCWRSIRWKTRAGVSDAALPVLEPGGRDRDGAPPLEVG